MPTKWLAQIWSAGLVGARGACYYHTTSDTKAGAIDLLCMWLRHNNFPEHVTLVIKERDAE